MGQLMVEAMAASVDINKWVLVARWLSERDELKFVGEEFKATMYELKNTPYTLRLVGNKIFWFKFLGYGQDGELPLLTPVPFISLLEDLDLVVEARDFLIFNIDLFR